MNKSKTKLAPHVRGDFLYPKKAKTKIPKRAPDYAQIASDLNRTFLSKGFTVDQAFELTAIVLSKA
jgi:hypothetical protein